MEMKDYKPNSHRYKAELAEKAAEKKPIEKAIKGTAKVRKKSEVRKFADTFLSEDMSSVKTFVIHDVLIPTIKNALSEIIRVGSDILIFGDAGHSKSSRNSSKVSYSRFYDDKRDSNRDNNRTRSGYSYDDITLDSRAEAEEVLRLMDDIIEEYGMVSVADLYDLVGVTGRHTDHNYGWTNLRNAEAVRVRDGYLLKFPRVTPIK